MIARVAATRTYEKRISKLLPNESRIEMENFIASNPSVHPVIPGTNGVRKARWSRPGMGKRGGIRTIFYYFAEPEIVLMVTAYGKNEMENLDEHDRKEIRKIVDQFKQTRN